MRIEHEFADPQEQRAWESAIDEMIDAGRSPGELGLMLDLEAENRDLRDEAADLRDELHDATKRMERAEGDIELASALLPLLPLLVRVDAALVREEGSCPGCGYPGTIWLGFGERLDLRDRLATVRSGALADLLEGAA